MTLQTRVVLVEPEHEGNIGSIARVMKNFNLKELWLVKPKVVLGLEASVYAVNAQEVISSARVVQTLSEAIANVDSIVGTTAKVGWSTRNVLRTPIDAKLLAKEVSKRRGRVALLFGRESKGLSNRELNLCDVIVSIPTNPAYRTLNIAAAATIILYELFSATLASDSLRKMEADVRALHMVEDYFEEICTSLRLSPHKREITVRALKNILQRSYVSRREASLLIGAMRRTVLRLKAQG